METTQTTAALNMDVISSPDFRTHSALQRMKKNDIIDWAEEQGLLADMDIEDVEALNKGVLVTLLADAQLKEVHSSGAASAAAFAAKQVKERKRTAQAAAVVVVEPVKPKAQVRKQKAAVRKPNSVKKLAKSAAPKKAAAVKTTVAAVCCVEDCSNSVRRSSTGMCWGHHAKHTAA